MATLTERIKQRAHDMGFDLAGVAAAGPSRTFGAFTEWLAHGYAGEMAYLAHERNLERRRDVAAILPEARSVVVVAMNYAAHERGGAAEADNARGGDATGRQVPGYPVTGLTDYPVPPGRGRVARYARNDDYHELMLGRLLALVDFMRVEAGRVCQARAYVDSGPVLEREWAKRAGLGWLGKNTHLIHPRTGSWLLLGEILTDLALDPCTLPESDHCGTCTRCLDACPTGAFVAPGVLDARRCISYLTIELKGAISTELRPLMGDWIFGCDVCQEVCPWNRKFARPTAERGLQPRDDLAAPDLLALLALDDAGFRDRFKRSPIRRAKRRGLLRNVAVALAKPGNQVAVPALARSLRDPEPLVRQHAAWALGIIGTDAAAVALREALVLEAEPEVAAEIERALR